MSFNTNHFTIVLQAEPEGGYTVTVPALPGCVTFGKTPEEASVMAQDAIGAYLVSMKKHGELIPMDRFSMLAAVDVAMP